MFTGCGTALVTPFRKNLSLDEEAVRRLVRRQVEAGINFLVPCGTTGESPTLSQAEQRRVVEITIEEARRGKIPVVAGAGGNNTADVIERAREFEALGADGILSVSPYYNKPTQEGPLPAFQGHRRSDLAADHSLQHSGAHGREHRAGHGQAASRKSTTSSA